MKAYPLFHANDFYHQTYNIINSAKAGDELVLNYFVIREDSKGLELLLWIYLASLRNVKIKLIIDSYGSCLPGGSGTEYLGKAISNRTLAFLRLHGIEVFIYRPVESSHILYPKNILNWKNFSRRNHNKILAYKLSGRRGAIIGDSQWANEHFNGAFLGHDILIESDQLFIEANIYCLNLVEQDECVNFKDLYKDKLDFIDIEIIREKLLSSAKIENPQSLDCLEHVIIDNVSFVYSEIEFSEHEKRKSIQDYEAILLSEKFSWGIYVTPYFSPDNQFLRSLKKFLKNGGEIRIGKFRNDPYLPYGVLSACKKLFKSKFSLWEFIGVGNIHYKDLVTSNAVFIKSANGEGRSRFYNLDSGVIIRSAELSKVFKREHDLRKNDFLELKDFQSDQIPHGLLERTFKLMLRPFYYHHL